MLFGTLHVRSGHRILLALEHQQAQDFQAFLDVLAWHCRGWRLVLLLDENPSHTAGGSQSLAEDLEIELLWLPKRAPELNAMDHLWRHGKAMVSVNRQYASVDEHMARLVGHLLALSPIQALRQAGILSDSFWLRGCVSSWPRNDRTSEDLLSRTQNACGSPRWGGRGKAGDVGECPFGGCHACPAGMPPRATGLHRLLPRAATNA